MKKILTLTLLVFGGILANAQISQLPNKEIPEDYGYIVKLGQQVPDVTMELTDGERISTSDLKGKVVMLQFTASWCSVCRKEMPHIESQIWQKNKDNKNFVLVGIDMNEPIDKVKKFKEDIKITYPLALDPGGKIFYTFAAEGAGVTRNVIIDKTGKIAYMTRLYKEDEFQEMVDVIDYLLKQ